MDQNMQGTQFTAGGKRDPELGGLSDFPFRIRTTLQPLTDYYETAVKEEQNPEFVSQERAILEKIANTPALQGELDPFELLEHHQSSVEFILSGLIPPSIRHTLMKGAEGPFAFMPFYMTPKFLQAFDFMNDPSLTTTEAQIGRFLEVTDVSPAEYLWASTFSAYKLILHKHYGLEIPMDDLIVFTIPSNDGRLINHYRMESDNTFVRVHADSDAPVLTEEDKREILNNYGNLPLLLEKIPPQHFTIEGFILSTLINVTDQELYSRLKSDLLQKDSLVNHDKLQEIKWKLRNLMRLPDANLVLVSFLNTGQGKPEHLVMLGDLRVDVEDCGIEENDYYTSVLGKAVMQQRPLIIDDMRKLENPNTFEKALIEGAGVVSFLVVPLMFDDKLTGLLMMDTTYPAAFNGLNVSKLSVALDFFSIAVRRSMEDREALIETVIKDECTAIHPSVNWRFRAAARNLIDARKENPHAGMEEIVFKDVFPLFGLSDIRNSTDNRNASIQADLMEFLGHTAGILEKAHKREPLLVFEELLFRINEKRARIEKELESGDEIGIQDFLQYEIETVLDDVIALHPEMEPDVKIFKKTLQPGGSVFYKRRKEYESSVSTLNNLIAGILDKAQGEAQKMIPHYFERYKTDGVEFGMYAGQSLLNGQHFTKLHLWSLRLWQLMTMCDIVRASELLKPELAIPLETAHLLLVQDSPLDIRFRLDEKQFDVDGTYNIRYEIMKKRIDKAVIEGTGERLTQPGKIAIVYAHTREAAEYKRYLAWLKSKGYLTGAIEEFRLQTLQGVHGLRGLRVQVNINGTSAAENATADKVEEIVAEIAGQRN